MWTGSPDGAAEDIKDADAVLRRRSYEHFTCELVVTEGNAHLTRPGAGSCSRSGKPEFASWTIWRCWSSIVIASLEGET